MEELRKKTDELISMIDVGDEIDEDSCRKLNKLRLIKRILEDDMCFFQMSIDDAYNILEDLGVQDIKEKYFELVSSENLKNVRGEND